MIRTNALEEIRGAIRELQSSAIELERQSASSLSLVHPTHLPSARNLLHYAALRRVDLRPLQERLAALGLSSLGRAESHVLDNLDSVEQILTYLLGLPPSPHTTFPYQPEERLGMAAEKLESNLIRLLGKDQAGRRTRIMVTAPDEAAQDPGFSEELLLGGMDVLRINCAKDDPDVWAKMIENLRAAERKTKRSCLVSMDLGGPKIRTGAIKKGKIRLEQGQRLFLVKEREKGRGARKRDGKREEARVGCTLPQVLEDLQPGHRVHFDDGKFSGKVLEVSQESALIELDRVPPRGGSLKADKGINLPDTYLKLPALTGEDREALDFVTVHADIVAQSFIRNAGDVRELHEELLRRDAKEIGLILKLETPSAFAHLPEVLLAGLAHRRVGAMVARGDLAVEVGFERLAEAQEEILWMCEAAHMPVVWATQVLESLAKRGLPSRAEVTDAAMASRAECVMLNKGDYIVEAVRFLSDVLTRMEAHHRKKRAQLRRLSISGPHSQS